MDENINNQSGEFQDEEFREIFGDGEELKKVFEPEQEPEAPEEPVEPEQEAVPEEAVSEEAEEETGMTENMDPTDVKRARR